ncbi:MAG: metallophosphoesterase family protein [Hyphomicrobiales bacterium]
MFRLAHLSDPHLAPLPEAKISELLSKRLTGYLSWKLKRRKIHHMPVLEAMVEDIQRMAPDATAVTGDLVNISLEKEFTAARDWLKTVGTPDKVAVIPGNHDAYVKVDWERGIGLWQDYMRGNTAVPGKPEDEPFPFVRTYRNIAVIGTSTAVETWPFQASGKLGPKQMELLAKTLSHLRERGFFRILLIHHPPLPSLTLPRKELKDAPALEQILREEGSELVLHGHNHIHMHSTLPSRHGPVHVFGVPSASARKTDRKPAAAWNLYSIQRTSGKWQCSVEVRGFENAESGFKQYQTITL